MGVAFQEAMMHSRSGDKIIENSTKKDNQSIKWCDKELSEGSRKNYTHVEDLCRGKVAGNE